MQLDDIFSENGILSTRLPQFEYRGEQLKMADSVFRALCKERHLIVEGGTGVGKSLAYLIPLCLWLKDQDSPRAIVSTYTKALQRQLFEKELPFIKKHLFPHLRYALSFGSDNYICLKRLRRTKQLGLFEIGEGDAIKLLLNWTRRSPTGLRSEIDIPNTTWQKVKREPDICSGKKCAYFSECLYQTAKILERKAHIIIANHHLYFAHVASNFNVLPYTRCVVFDEAHEIVNVASDYLGAEVSSSGLRYLLDSIISPKGKGLLMTIKWLDPGQTREVSAVADRTRRCGDGFFREINNFIGNRRNARIREKKVAGDDLIENLHALILAIENIEKSSSDEDEKEEISAITRRCIFFRENLQNIIYQGLDDHVYWASADNRSVRITATPLKVAGIMRETVFRPLSASILTSATLAVNNKFDFIKNQLGLEDADTDIFSSPFDFKSQAVVYLPDDTPEPNSESYADALTERIEVILRYACGNSMVLFTSYALLDEVANKLNIDYPILKQGDRDNYQLLKEFMARQPSALFGTYTFWQGIDMQGDILKCVVITKLPFAVPTEPVTEARLEMIKSEGRDPFNELQVPNAVITFRQGFGRLIRARTDRGVIAVLDSRILKKPYGRYFIDSLPDINIVNDHKIIQEFLKPGI